MTREERRSRPHCVYRCFGHKGELIYIGCSVNPDSRLEQHRRHREWWPDVVFVTRVWYPDHASGFAAERKAIDTEGARENIPQAEITRRIRVTQARTDRLLRAAEAVA